MPAPSPTAADAGRSVARESLTGLLRGAARLDRTQSDPVVALRNAVGVAAPLILGAATGSAGAGLAATIGALQTAFADRPGPYRLRILRMMGTALAAGVTSGLAVAASAHEATSLLLLLIITFGAGLLLTAGPSATQVGVASVAAALILGHTPHPGASAVHVGLLVLAGGAFQAVLAIAAWPLGRHRPERDALAGLYRALAMVARRPVGSTVGPPAGDVLTTVRLTLYGLGHDHGPSVEAYRVLLDEAERIRRELIVLGAAVERLVEARTPILAGLVRAALSESAGVLDELAGALTQGRSVDEAVLQRARGAIRHAVVRLEDSDGAPAELTRRAAAARLRALAGQLRAAVESTRTGASEGRHGAEPMTRGMRLLRDPIAILRANLTPDSAVLRHAVRAAVLVTASDLVVRVLGVQRGYWVALTILVVLRPDFGATLQRSVLRVIGSIVGVLLATVLVHFVPGGQWWHVALIALFAFGMRLAGPGNVGLTSLSLSALVVVLLEINGVSAHDTVINRSVSTLVGGTLAVVAVLALPAWERQFVPARLGALLRAYRTYLGVVADPNAGRSELQQARSASRLARTNAQASVDRARAEPVRADAELELGEMVLAHTHRFVHATLALDTVRRSVREAGGLVLLADFLRAAGETLSLAEHAVDSGDVPGPGSTSLQHLHDELSERVTADPARVGGPAAATIVVDATDRMTNSLDTLIDELRRQLGTSVAKAG